MARRPPQEQSDPAVSCYGKDPYTAWQAYQQSRRYPLMQPYRCRFCGRYHVGHRLKGKR